MSKKGLLKVKKFVNEQKHEFDKIVQLIGEEINKETGEVKTEQNGNKR